VGHGSRKVKGMMSAPAVSAIAGGSWLGRSGPHLRQPRLYWDELRLSWVDHALAAVRSGHTLVVLRRSGCRSATGAVLAVLEIGPRGRIYD
jgi:hypothetical protein